MAGKGWAVRLTFGSVSPATAERRFQAEGRRFEILPRYERGPLAKQGVLWFLRTVRAAHCGAFCLWCGSVAADFDDDLSFGSTRLAVVVGVRGFVEGVGAVDYRAKVPVGQ